MFKRVINEGYSFLLDGTFALASARKNIEMVLKNSYDKVSIYFVYQDPLIAWKFVKNREIIEGRHVPKMSFINAYFMSRYNVIRAKEKFGDLINITILFKDFHGNISETHADTDNIELILPKLYTKEFLRGNLNE